jgi:hypothetical protein
MDIPSPEAFRQTRFTLLGVDYVPVAAVGLRHLPLQVPNSEHRTAFEIRQEKVLIVHKPAILRNIAIM